MKVDPILNWAEWKFNKASGPIAFRVFGNPETAVAIKFFLYASDGATVAEEAIRDENEPYALDPAAMNASRKLGFIFIARPILPAGRDLFAWIEARQDGTQDRQQAYRYTLEDSENFFKMSDGITITL